MLFLVWFVCKKSIIFQMGRSGPTRGEGTRHVPASGRGNTPREQIDVQHTGHLLFQVYRTVKVEIAYYYFLLFLLLIGAIHTSHVKGEGVDFV